MINDPELKAMSDVYDALQNLDGATQKRVVDWVLSKLESPSSSALTGAKRGPKPGSKRGRKRGRKLGSSLAIKTTGAKRGPKPGVKKRGPKPGTGGRPKGSSKKSSSGRRGRPRKNSISNLE
jgi:hypothetical protein